jgi:hypothetical protein
MMWNIVTTEVELLATKSTPEEVVRMSMIASDDDYRVEMELRRPGTSLSESPFLTISISGEDLAHMVKVSMLCRQPPVENA